MANVLESALKAVLDGLGSVNGPGTDVTQYMAKLGFDVPPGARPGVEAIIGALPTGGAVGIGGGLDALLNQIRTFVDLLRTQPAAFAGGLAAYGAHLKDNLPRRLLDYVVVTETQKRVPLVAGLLRMAGIFSIGTVITPPQFEVAGPRFAIDLDQLLLMIRDPKAGLRWGQVDFKSPAIVWGLEDIVRAIKGDPAPAQESRLTLARADETGLLVRDAGAVPDSAAAAVTVGRRTVRLAGLHEKGLVVVPLTISLNVGLPDPVKQGIHNGTGIDPDSGDKPGLWISPDKIDALKGAAGVLPGGN